ncbi:MAG: molybdate ABC transporter substrate-binding protein [Acidobacteria bacterium]|nr:molybdate ABC transporter substrate-binding protein [Acidobacteriota bacterium]
MAAGVLSLAAAVVAIVSVGCAGRAPADRPRPSATVFAAASLQSVLDDLAPRIARDIGVDVHPSYAASSVLARQIEHGAPADLFISADQAWMDDAAAHGRIQAGSRVDLVGNALVLIAPAARPISLTLTAGAPIAAALAGGRLAVADPDTVPAGRYARAALTRLGVWQDVADRLAPADNVRAALLFVARGEAPLGIVYRTDAIAEPRVAIVDVFPAGTHPPIVYPAALTVTASPHSARVLDYLHSADAIAVFLRHGFTIVDPEHQGTRTE